jgi:hypothetical protein
MLEIIGSDREKLNELQADVTGYLLAEVIWRSRNGAWNT